MAKRSVRRRKSSRRWVPLVLLGFVLVATGVIARRIYGIEQNRRIVQLEQRKQALEAERLRLEGAIRDASSRSRLVPLAEQRLNMHVPSPNQVIMLPRTPSAGSRSALPNDSR